MSFFPLLDCKIAATRAPSSDTSGGPTAAAAASPANSSPTFCWVGNVTRTPTACDSNATALSIWYITSPFATGLATISGTRNSSANSWVVQYYMWNKLCRFLSGAIWKLAVWHALYIITAGEVGVTKYHRSVQSTNWFLNSRILSIITIVKLSVPVSAHTLNQGLSPVRYTAPRSRAAQLVASSTTGTSRMSANPHLIRIKNKK